MENSENQIQEILERLVRMETKLDNYNALKDKADEAFTVSKQGEKDIKEIKDNIKWCWRTIVGAIIVGAIGIYMKL
jgi:hypothetical protein